MLESQSVDIIQQLVKLIKINTKISSLHSSDEILREIMDEAMSLTGTSAAFVLRVPREGELSCRARYERTKDDREISWSSSSALEARDAGRTVYSTRALESSPAPSIVAGSIQTLISAPLSEEGGEALVLQLVGRDITSIDPQMISLVNLFISQVQVTTTRAELEEAAVRNAALAATGALASQVVHDIRSPLSALQVVVREASRLPEEHRELLLGAIGRIREIAEGLLQKDKASRVPAPAVQLLAPLVEPLCAEKRAQYAGLKLACRLDSEARARVVPAELKRLLSNLVDNAVQALEGRPGSVTVTLSARGGFARLEVVDDGKGIPPEVLGRLGRRGETHGKAGGSGLGLHHARTTAEAWGGRLEISSTPGKGTTVAVLLPDH